ncbi:MAG: carboxypeptidase regulatory-like domain-containing protein [Phycisphaerae bacterium]|nr:carboxypeptidase regulatory-like domain-containing protein [Saprospiraceae bacterium]
MTTLRFTLLAFLAVCAAMLPAQSPDQAFRPYTLAFQLSDVEATAMVRNPKLPFDEKWLHTLTDTLFQPAEKQSLPPGAYLLVKANEETLEAEFFLLNALKINLLNTHRDFAFALVDSLGNDVPDARVLLDGHPVAFDPQQKCYRLPKQKHGGLLEVHARGELLLADVQRERDWNRKPLWSVYYQILNKKKGFNRQAYKPVALAKAMYWHAKRKAQSKDRKRKYHQSHARAFKGYMTVSQPLYRPGDTLRVKAYLTTGTKGKPWNKPMKMTLAHYEGSVAIQRMVLPSSPGSFEYEWPLGDSLKLDMDAWVGFFDTPKDPDKQRGMSVRFRYEDYELDEVKFEVKASQESYRCDEPVTITLRTIDVNGQPMVEGQLALTMLSGGVSQYFASELYLPDTLWHTTLPLSPSGETLVIVPDSVWPEASLRVSGIAQFTNSAGELQGKTFAFNMEREEVPIEASISKDSISIFFKTNSRAPFSRIGEGFSLIEIWHDRENTRRAITLPYNAAIPAGLQDLQLLANGKKVPINLLENTSLTEEPGSSSWWESDTAHFKMTNPARVPLRWWVARNKEIVAQGTTSEPTWHWEIPGSDPADYTLHCAYTWEGNEESGYEFLQRTPQNLLSIKLEQPKQVQPGEQLQVKIKVLDAQERPVQNAQLSAGAYNAQFESLKTDRYDPRLPYVAPVIKQIYPPKFLRRRGSAKIPRRYKEFEINDIDGKSFTIPFSRSWQKRMGVKNLLYYRLRNIPAETLPQLGAVRGFYEASPLDSSAYAHPRHGRLPNLPASEDSFAFHRPQFAPYIVQGGKAVPIHLIWCNNQLVWYSGCTDSRPYSFYGNPGYNMLKLRTSDGEITLDSLWLTKGERLVFSIEKEDIEMAWNFPKVLNFREVGTSVKPRVRYQPRSSSLTSFERNTLQQTMLLWQPEGYGNGYQYFWQSAENIHVVYDGQGHYSSKNKPHIVGPFPPGSTITTLRQDKFLSRFKFEPGFVYKIEEGRERLYESSWPDDSMRLTSKSALSRPFFRALGPQDIFPVRKEKPRVNYSQTGRVQRGMGQFDLGQLPNDVPLLAFALAGDTLLGPFHLANRRVSGIRPGTYRLLLLSMEGTMAERSIVIRPNAIFHLDFQETAFRKPLPGESLDSLFRLNWSETDMRLFLSQTVPFTPFSGLGSAWALQGTVTDDSGETLIGATVKVSQNGIFVAGTITDVEGYYSIALAPGIYEVEVNYTGFQTQRLVGVQVFSTRSRSKQNFVMEVSTGLQEVVITALGMAREKKVLAYATVAGASSIDGGEINIRGARANGTDYYIDGVRMDREVPPVMDLEQLFVNPTEARNQFSDYAYWQPNLRTDAKGEAFFQVTFPDNITAWRSYVLGMDRRARAGMALQTTQAFQPLQAQLSLPRFAIAGDQFDAVGRVRNLHKDSTNLRTQFVFEGKILKEKTTRIGPSLVETQSIEVPQNADSLTLAYKMQDSNTSDGEERSIAILPLGTLERNGQFLLLEGDTSLSLDFDPAKGPVWVQSRQSALPLLVEDLDYLKNYPYGCNEQTASRLLALLAERDISAFLRQGIPPEKPLRECLKRLEKNQLPDGSWGWWGGGRSNAWMTAYVVKVLFKADKAGFTTTTPLQNGLTWLRQNLVGMSAAEQHTALFALRECGVNLDCKPFLAAIGNTPFQSLSTLRLRHLCGEKILRDSLMRWLQATATGGLKATGSEYGWYNCSAQNTLMAYDIAADAGWADLTKGIRRYWLESRSTARQRNTIETAQILQRLLPTVLDAEGHLTESSLTINGVRLANLTQKLQMNITQQAISVTKKGRSPVYVAAWQEWQNPQPWAVDNLFKVETRLEQGGQTVTALRKGEPAELVLTLDAHKSAEYLMLEVPIPAGCSYGVKTQGNSTESHREYFRERTAIFCEDLPAGRHTFRIALEPRFTGSFSLNAARAELMYFPVLFGRNEGKRVEVGE